LQVPILLGVFRKFNQGRLVSVSCTSIAVAPHGLAIQGGTGTENNTSFQTENALCSGFNEMAMGDTIRKRWKGGTWGCRSMVQN